MPGGGSSFFLFRRHVGGSKHVQQDTGQHVPMGCGGGGVSGVATPMAPNAGSTQSYPVFCITPILKDC